MKNLIESKEWYINLLKTEYGNSDRIIQTEEIVDILKDNGILWNTINVIETGASWRWGDGMMGLFFGKLSSLNGGKFYSVDINEYCVKESIEKFKKYLPELKFNHFINDSIKFLKNVDLTEINLVHLDSWDLDLLNPYPSALHGWREFESIKDRLNVGSVVIVDDNYFQNTWVEYTSIDNSTNEVIKIQKVDIDVPVVGKGAHIYQWCLESEEWEVLNKTKRAGNNKIIVKKIK